jgi:zinc protease
MRLFLSLLAFITVLFLPPAANAKIFEAERFMLKNGMEVIVLPNHRAPVVSQMVWYRVGAADEPIGKSGIAHFLEHLMFKGTATIPDGQFSKRINALGGNDNAFTGQDFTAYFQSVGKAHLETIMTMEADRMRNLVLAEEQIISERNVIIEERKTRVDNDPMAILNEQMDNALFINHPYAIPVIGWLHEMKTLSREDALAFYQKWYCPSNAILILSGDIDPATAKTLAEKYYGVIAETDVKRQNRPLPAPILAERRLSYSDANISVPVLQIRYRAPRGSAALTVLSDILGGNSTSRLYQRLVVDQKIAVSIGSSYDAISLNDTSFDLYATPASGISLSDLEKAIIAEINSITENGVSKNELKAAQGRIIAKAIYARDSLLGPAMVVGRFMASGFTLDEAQNWPKSIENVTHKDIITEAQKIFHGENKPVIGLALPKEKK